MCIYLSNLKLDLRHQNKSNIIKELFKISSLLSLHPPKWTRGKLYLQFCVKSLPFYIRNFLSCYSWLARLACGTSGINSCRPAEAIRAAIHSTLAPEPCYVRLDDHFHCAAAQGGEIFVPYLSVDLSCCCRHPGLRSKDFLPPPRQDQDEALPGPHQRACVRLVSNSFEQKV